MTRVDTGGSWAMHYSGVAQALLVVAVLLAWPSCTAQRIAIIGGGLAGTTSAHWLKKDLPAARITLFESSSQLGGRAAEVTIGGQVPCSRVGSA